KYFVKAHGWFEDDRRLYIAMDFCENGDLATQIIQQGPMKESEARDIVWQILQGVKAMHENGFALRDLKPAVCTVRPEHLNICDFGLSKRSLGDNTYTSAIKGTPGYLAPELLTRDGQTANPYPCDMWCLGEIAYNLLTGQSVFRDLQSLLMYHMGHQEFPARALLDRVGNSTDSDAFTFVTALMKSDPKDRLTAGRAGGHRWM
ncbi:kinase-like domain-containing protein, partial [Microdochium bolleyi]